MVASLVPLILAVGFVAVCLVDLFRNPHVRHLSRPLWALVILITIPFGGIIYLTVGRGQEEGTVRTPDARPANMPAVAPPAVRQPPAIAAVGPVGPGGSIVVDGLSKHFGPVVAVDGLTFEVRPGHVTGFLGPNGSGKTTTMRVILGLDTPTAGRVSIGGRRYRDMVRPLHQVGALLDANAAHPGRSARSHILAIAQSNGMGRRRVEEVLELTGLSSVADRRVREFSLGMKQRLGIAAALLGDPSILMFDEPVNGLDPEGVHWIRELLRALAAQGRTVFVSSHLMSEMALTADHLVIIGRGRLLADTSTHAFVEAGARRDVLVRSPRASELIEPLTRAGGQVAADGADSLSVTGVEAAAIGELAAARQIALHELTPRHGSLEDAYLDLTRESVEYRAGADGALPVPGGRP